MEMNVSAPATRGPSLAIYFGFSGSIYFYQRVSGARAAAGKSLINMKFTNVFTGGITPYVRAIKETAKNKSE